MILLLLIRAFLPLTTYNKIHYCLLFQRGQENPNVTTSSVPGGMGASMATAHQAHKK
ncbi:hypothetical protein AAHE18_16G020300 [Arachis hypogaea]